MHDPAHRFDTVCQIVVLRANVVRDVAANGRGGETAFSELWRSGFAATVVCRWRPIDPGQGASYVSGMATLPIMTLPNPLLRQKSAAVERIDADLGKLADDMLETMYAAPGVGLAAVQVGVPRRLIVVDTAKEEDPPAPLIMINPEIITLGSKLRLHEEGCLSIPDERIEIERPASLTVRFLDRNGQLNELAAEGLLATVIQHEIDHLDGRLIIDYVSRLKRDIIIRRFKKLAKTGAGA